MKCSRGFGSPGASADSTSLAQFNRSSACTLWLDCLRADGSYSTHGHSDNDSWFCPHDLADSLASCMLWLLRGADLRVSSYFYTYTLTSYILHTDNVAGRNVIIASTGSTGINIYSCQGCRLLL